MSCQRHAAPPQRALRARGCGCRSGANVLLDRLTGWLRASPPWRLLGNVQTNAGGAGAMVSAAVVSRMSREIRMLQMEPPPGVWAAPVGDKVTELEAQLQVGTARRSAQASRLVQGGGQRQEPKPGAPSYDRENVGGGVAAAAAATASVPHRRLLPVLLQGPKDTVYEGGLFKLAVHIPARCCSCRRRSLSAQMPPLLPPNVIVCAEALSVAARLCTPVQVPLRAAQGQVCDPHLPPKHRPRCGGLKAAGRGSAFVHACLRRHPAARLLGAAMHASSPRQHGEHLPPLRPAAALLIIAPSIKIPLSCPPPPPRNTNNTNTTPAEGRICLDILNMPPKGAWKPSLNVPTLLASVGLLLAEPNPDDGLVTDIVR